MAEIRTLGDEAAATVAAAVADPDNTEKAAAAKVAQAAIEAARIRETEAEAAALGDNPIVRNPETGGITWAKLHISHEDASVSCYRTKMEESYSHIAG
jgi:hypothetical protein